MNIEPIFTFPKVEEMSQRLAKVRAAMREQGLDYYVAHCPDNIFYLTNFANYVHERPFVLVISDRGAPRFVVPKLEIPHVMSRQVGELELIEYFEFPAPAGETWADRFRAQFTEGATVGVESVCPLQVYEEIPGTTIRADIIDDCRQVKTDFEISRIKYASDVAVDEAVKNVFKRAGYAENLLHRTGHSIGVTGHEAPFLAEGYHREIQPGMFFTIEPGIYLPGTGGFRH